MKDIMTPVAMPVEEETLLDESPEERTRMTPEMFTRQWAQIRQELRGWWDHLTEHDLEQIAGHQEQLVRVIQERYQYVHERAQAEVDQRLQAYEPTGGQMAEALIAAADEAASRLTEAGEAGRADAAGTPPLDLGAGGLVALVRRHPVASVLIGLGVGVLLARGLARTRSLQGLSRVALGADPARPDRRRTETRDVLRHHRGTGALPPSGGGGTGHASRVPPMRIT